MKHARILVSLCSTLTILAQGSVIGAAPSDKPPTLADTLIKVPPSRDTIVITVTAENVTLPKDTSLPSVTDNIAEIAKSYGQITQSYNTVTAIAPASITVVQSPPEEPKPYYGLLPDQVMKMLGTTLSSDQWQALLSHNGMAYTSMKTEMQRQLFEALFPDGHLLAVQDNASATKIDMSGPQLAEAHLRIAYIVGIGLKFAGNTNDHIYLDTPAKPGDPTFAGNPPVNGARVRYFMMNARAESSQDVDQEFGAPVRQTVPNTLKPGDLNFSDAEFGRFVGLERVHTVSDLIAKIASVTNRELYADPRYGMRTVTLLTSASAAPASDLLQALAVCVGGTYRQVGPAYVLTNDIIGHGTQHEHWKVFEEKAKAMLPDANPFTVSSPYSVLDIPWSDDPIAFTDEQQKQYWAKWRTYPLFFGFVRTRLNLPFSALTPAQQEAALREQQLPSRFKTTLDGNVEMQITPVIEVLLHSLGGPVLVSGNFTLLLPSPNQNAHDQNSIPQLFPVTMPTPQRTETPTKKTPLRPIMEQFARRAVRAAPKSLQEVTSILGNAKTLGLNELWLEITPNADEATDQDTVTFVTQAASQAKAAGITLIPDIHLLWWGDEPPAKFADRTLLNVTPSEYEKIHHYANLDSRNTVSIFEPKVQRRLQALVRQISTVPDIGGMVWENLMPAGYQDLSVEHGDTTPLNALGYTEAGRLANLRANHFDPIDLYSYDDTFMRANVDVAGFNNSAQDRTLYYQWRVYRAQSAYNFAQLLASQLPSSFDNGPESLPIIVTPSNQFGNTLYGSWDDMNQPMPIAEYSNPHDASGHVIAGAMAIESMKSKVFYRAAQRHGLLTDDAKTWADTTDRAIQEAAKPGHENLVIDITQKPELLQALVDNEAQ